MGWENALLSAIDKNDIKSVNEAISQGADVNFIQGYPLRMSVDSRNKDIFLLLVKNKANLLDTIKYYLRFNNKDALEFIVHSDNDLLTNNTIPKKYQELLLTKLL